MATDLTAQICTNCAHASLCPHREEFLAFFANRDQVMVKCLNDDGQLNDDVSFSVRIEHRYLDGPGLEKVYKELNLGGAGWFPCMTAHSSCPFFRNPFQSPVFAPYPVPAGYVNPDDPICLDARDAAGNKLPYIAPCYPPATNQIYATPYAPVRTSANQYWSCASCAEYDRCKDEFDYAKLGGTVYSTFAIDYQSTKEGDVIKLDSIAIPDVILPGYERANRNPASFTITSETDVLIIYYTYVGTQEERPQWSTIDTLKEEGKIHTMQFFYGERAYIYPTLTSDQVVGMNVQMMRVVCGHNNRQDANGKAYTQGMTIPFASAGTGKLSLYYNGAVLKEPTEADLNAMSVNVSGVSYQVCDEMVEGDTVTIKFTFDRRYKIDTTIMKLMNYGIDFIDFTAKEYLLSNSTYSTAYLTFTVPEGDFIVQTVLVRRTMVLDPITYPPIDYESLWNPYEIHWGTHQVAVTIGDEIVQVSQPIAPRKWDKAIIGDMTPYYATNFPPDDTCIVRPGFNLLGYSDDEPLRATFDADMPIFNAEEMEYVIILTNDDKILKGNDEYSAIAARVSSTEDTVADKTGYMQILQKNVFGVETKKLRNKPEEIHVYMRRDTSNIENIVQEEGFLATDVDSTIENGWAMWKLDADVLDGEIVAGLQAMDANIVVNTDQALYDALPIKVADMLNSEIESKDPYMTEVYEPVILDWSMEYMPNQAQRLLSTLLATELPDNFIFSLFRLPSDLNELLLYSAWPANDTFITPDPTGMVNDNTPLDRYKVTEISSDEFTNELSANYLLIIKPSHAYGMNPHYQNFMAYVIRTTQKQKELSLHVVFDGADLAVQPPEYENMKSYTLNGVYPDDAGKVDISVTNNVIELTGERAPFYKLTTSATISYMQRITHEITYENDCKREESQYDIPYCGSIVLTVAPPSGDSLSKIEVAGKQIYGIVENERVFTKQDYDDGMGAYATMENGIFKIYLTGVRSDQTVNTTLRHGDDGSIEGCSRCNKYVDTSDRTYMEWIPVCHDYDPN